MIRWEVQRFRPEGVEALEVWNLPHRGGLLYQRLGTPAVEDAERAGQAAREVDAMLGEAVAFAQMLLAPQGPVWLAGGLCLRPGLRAALAPHRLQGLRFAPEPLFPGEVGAEQALARLGRKGGVLVDLGQTSIKLSALGAKPGREVVPRPLERLPRFFTERLPPPSMATSWYQCGPRVCFASIVCVRATQLKSGTTMLRCGGEDETGGAEDKPETGRCPAPRTRSSLV